MRDLVHDHFRLGSGLVLEELRDLRLATGNVMLAIPINTRDPMLRVLGPMMSSAYWAIDACIKAEEARIAALPQEATAHAA